MAVRNLIILTRNVDIPFDVESKDFDTIIILSFHCFFTSIEFLALVDVFTTGITTPTQQYEHKAQHIHH